jgi:hypothetical protein
VSGQLAELTSQAKLIYVSKIGEEGLIADLRREAKLNDTGSTRELG